VADAISTQLGDALRPLWLDDVNVVLLHAPTKESLATLSSLGSMPGVRFIDRTGDISALMQRWRIGMTELLSAGYAVIFAALFFRFRGRAWRALLPTAVASALALATVGFLGEPLTLFHVLALWLLLGMGVDYGIFLVEHPADDGEAWLAIGLGAVSTLLSFGLLAVSTTPAIHAFGTTLGVGVTLVWLLSPLSAPRDVRAR
jgi:predicted exporter